MEKTNQELNQFLEKLDGPGKGNANEALVRDITLIKDGSYTAANLDSWQNARYEENEANKAKPENVTLLSGN